jgi:hypothetical protein
MIFGIPSRSTAAVYQNDDPLVSEAFSTNVNSDNTRSTSNTTGVT